MKKLLLFLFALSVPLLASAQILKERRVYYLDCSFSMVTNGLWDPVREDLKKAIDAVNDETTELIVIPFAIDGQHHHSLNAITAKADEAGKNKLKNRIDALTCSKSSMTYHCDPISDFNNGRVAPSKVTYMFLMTDGADEDNKGDFDTIVKNQWTSKYGNKNVYGFYVMLHDSAQNNNRESIIDEAKHFWKVKSADVNINLLRLEDNAVFNVRNDECIEIPINGDSSGIDFSADFNDSSLYKVKNVKKKNNKLIVYIDSNLPKSQLPESEPLSLNIRVKGAGPMTFLVTEKVNVVCQNKKQRSLKVSVR